MRSAVEITHQKTVPDTGSYSTYAHEFIQTPAARAHPLMQYYACNLRLRISVFLETNQTTIAISQICIARKYRWIEIYLWNYALQKFKLNNFLYIYAHPLNVYSNLKTAMLFIGFRQLRIFVVTGKNDYGIAGKTCPTKHRTNRIFDVPTLSASTCRTSNAEAQNMDAFRQKRTCVCVCVSPSNHLSSGTERILWTLPSQRFEWHTENTFDKLKRARPPSSSSSSRRLPEKPANARKRVVRGSVVKVFVVFC